MWPRLLSLAPRGAVAGVTCKATAAAADFPAQLQGDTESDNPPGCLIPPYKKCVLVTAPHIETNFHTWRSQGRIHGHKARLCGPRFGEGRGRGIFHLR